MTRGRLFLLLCALPCLSLAGFALQSYPFARFELGVGLLAYAALGLWRPHLLLFALPLWLALVNLAPWSGSMYLEDYDLVLAVSLGVFLATGRYALSIRLTPAQWLFLGLLSISYAVSTLRGLWPLPPLDAIELSTYYSNWHAVRLAKGFVWALLLLPGLVALLREDHVRARMTLAWGLAAAGAAMGLVAMWERGVVNTALESGSVAAVVAHLLDFGTKYRITGLFSEMHTGGEAIDSFMAMTWPFGLLAAAQAKKRRWAWLGGLFFVLALYAVVCTFSRATYLALFAGLAMAAGLHFFPHAAHKTARRQDFLTLLGVLSPLALVGLYTPAGFYTVLIGLLAWAGALWGGAFSAKKSLPWGAAFALLAIVGAAWAMNGVRLNPDFPTSTLLALAVLVGAGGYWSGHRLVAPTGYKGVALTMMLVSGCIAVVTPALLGARMEKRLAGNRVDMVTRENHWHEALNLMPADWTTQLFGMGVGRFPAEYLWAGLQNDIGTYQFKRGADGNTVLALGGGQDARMTQRVALPAGEAFTLSLDARTDDERLWLRAMLYRRNILQQSDTPAQFRELNKHLENTHGQWRRVSWQFNIGDLGERGWTGRQPLLLEFMNWRRYEYLNRPGTLVEIDNVSLKDAQGREWLVNGDFSRGMERWFPYYDFNHLPWHIKNLLVHIYFDQGALGLVGLLGFLASTLAAAVHRARQGNAWGFTVSTAMASFLTVGLFGGLLDMPRVIFIAYLMLFVTALSGPSRSAWASR
ncbi:MAG: hypothetical protein B7Y41_08220 [Hydrogenophilales bacterium 28-61-23]|nr:MAG: hypothetical protein B7Y41_08220 [Hydrogenophilales bacterium 28-61-23]